MSTVSIDSIRPEMKQSVNNAHGEAPDGLANTAGEGGAWGERVGGGERRGGIESRQEARDKLQ